MKRTRVFLAGIVAVLAVVSVWVWAGRSEAATFKAQTTLKDAWGHAIGKAVFIGWHDYTDVRVHLWTVPADTALDAFHGFHIHSNDAGTGCVADPNQPANTWFVSVGGHWGVEGQVHPDHLGDMPSLLINADHTADARFRTGRFQPSELSGRALILHAGADNFANIPLGDQPTQYTANSPDAIAATKATGNAGNRIACGVITVSG